MELQQGEKNASTSHTILVGVADMFGLSGYVVMILYVTKKLTTFMEAIFWGTYLPQIWKLLQKEEEKSDIQGTCHAVEVVAMKIYTKKGW